MNVKQRNTRKALIGQVAGLLVGSKPLGGKKIRKMPFPGTPTTAVRPDGAMVKLHPEHQPVFRPASQGPNYLNFHKRKPTVGRNKPVYPGHPTRGRSPFTPPSITGDFGR